MDNISIKMAKQSVSKITGCDSAYNMQWNMFFGPWEERYAVEIHVC